MDKQTKLRRRRYAYVLAVLAAELAFPAMVSHCGHDEALDRQVEVLHGEDLPADFAGLKAVPAERWERANTASLRSLNPKSTATWIRQTIPPAEAGASEATRALVAEIDCVFLYMVDFYLAEGEQVLASAQTGSLRAGPGSAPRPTFRFSRSPAVSRQLYVRVESEGFALMPLIIRPAAAFARFAELRQLFLGTFMGCYIGILLFNLCFCVWLRERFYYYYTSYVLGAFLCASLMTSIACEVYPRIHADHRLAMTGVLLSLDVAIASYILFMCEFLALKINIPWIYRVTKAYLITAAVLAVVIPFLPAQLAIGAVLAFAGCGVLTAALSLPFFLQYQSIFIFVLAFLGLGATFLVTILSLLNLVPSSYMADNMVYFGVLWEGVFLAFAVADRIRSMKTERLAIISALQSEVPTSTLNKLLGSSYARSYKAAEMNVTIMFIDIVGFSQISQILGAQRIFGHLSQRLNGITAIIHEYGGVVDRSLGDGILCFFGYNSNIPTAGHARDAFLAAKKIQLASVASAGAAHIPLEDLDPLLPVRIGIHSANVFIGNIGSSSHIDFTMVGSGVNFASRLQVACAPFKIMLSEDAKRQIGPLDPGELPFHEIRIAVKHQDELVKAYEYNPAADKPEAFARAEHVYLTQLGVRAQDIRFDIQEGAPTFLVAGVARFRLLDFSYQGLRVEAPVLIGQRSLLTVEIHTFDMAVNTALHDKLLHSVQVEVRWSRGVGGAYQHGLKIIGLNPEQRQFIFSHLARLYANLPQVPAYPDWSSDAA